MKGGFAARELLIILGVLTAGLFIIVFYGVISIRASLHEQAIELNMGEYVVNPKTGDTDFKWKVTTNDHTISSCKFTNINGEVFIITVTKEIKLP